MFHCAGWLVLNIDPSLNVYGEQQSAKVRAESAKVEADLREIFVACQPVWINGNCFITLATSRNHEGGDVENLRQLLTDICERLPGTYGVLHYHDNEREFRPDTFTVIRVGSRKVCEEIDEAFSALTGYL